MACVSTWCSHWCQYWRAAIDGVAIGVAKYARFVRLKNAGYADQECESIIFGKS